MSAEGAVDLVPLLFALSYQDQHVTFGCFLHLVTGTLHLFEAFNKIHKDIKGLKKLKLTSP